VRFIRRADAAPNRLGILAGSFNPPTRAHLSLIEAAADHVDEVLCVVPQVFPHKIYHGATLDERLRMLESLRPAGVPLSVAVSEGGLFIDIARECRDAYGRAPHLLFLCGRDAAERIVEWDYGTPGAIARMMEEFGLLVAARLGEYAPPPHLAHRIHRLLVPREVEPISSTEVRDRIRRGEPWEHLVPASIVELAGRIYR
jgi:nicotinate-nucleotide adenylyltransferase